MWSAHEFMRQGVEWETDQTFTSEEPHDIPVPGTARPGTYRVCTVGLPDKLCTEFEIASA